MDNDHIMNNRPRQLCVICTHATLKFQVRTSAGYTMQITLVHYVRARTPSFSYAVSDHRAWWH